MQKSNIGFLLVEDASSRKALGVITDRDLVLQVLARGLAPETTTLMEIMTPHVETICENQDVFASIALMRGAECRRLAVADSSARIVGVLSMDDLVEGAAIELMGMARNMRMHHKRPLRHPV